MIDTPTSGPQKTLFTTTLALFLLAAGPALAQTNDEPTAGPTGGSGTEPLGLPPATPPPTPAPALAPEPPPPPASKRVKATAVEASAATEVPAGLQTPATSWFTRTPFRVLFGSENMPWAITFSGVLQADYIVDTTRSYNDFIGPTLVARSDTYEGSVGRTQFSMRNTRFGFTLDAPAIGGVTPSAVIQGDFSGNQPGVPYTPPGTAGPPTISENAYYGSPTFRIRHAYMTLRNPIVDILAGQTFDVFGWQNYFYGTALLGVPNQASSRTAQFRLSRRFGAGGPVSVDVAIAAARPGQRDSMVPDGEGGIKVNVHGWKGITTPGNAVTVAAPLAIGVSGVVRQFKVNAFTPPPTQSSNHAMGWGVAADLFAPIIPASSADDRGNKLTIVGSFAYGTGIADLLVTGGGARFPTLPNPAQQTPPPLYTPDVDNSLVTFDVLGVLHTIDWMTAKGSLQYYLPGSGRLILAGNFTWAHSQNIAKLFPRGRSDIELIGTVADTSISGDGSLLWDATPTIRFGLAGQYTWVHYIDRLNTPYNIRAIAQALYIF
jgi:hypothetical protein